MESRPADSIAPEMEKLRAKIGDLATCEEDVLTFAMFPDIGREFLQQRLDGTLQPEPLIPASKDKASGTVSTEFKVDVHGETYDVAITGVGDVGGGKRKMYISVDGMPEEVVFETIGEFVSDGAQQGRKKASDPGHVSTPLPGNVVEVLVNVGDKVASGQSTMIIEAMKMESELLANIDGEITAIHVSKGDRVTPGEVLIEIA